MVPSSAQSCCAEIAAGEESANYFVYASSGINQVQPIASGATCGDGKTINQSCALAPNNGPGGFQTLIAVDQANPPRMMQFSFAYKLITCR